MAQSQHSENIPPLFTTRKNKIIEELAIPDEDYTDLSPKGSVDLGVRDLIRDINALPGLVTTSSCAGRISVFLEGRRDVSSSEQEVNPEGAESEPEVQDDQRVFAPSGGKGAGRWLYVSHDPFPGLRSNPSNSNASSAPASLHEAFGLVPGDGKPPIVSAGKSLRLVRFHYDPLVCTRVFLSIVSILLTVQILHVMAASLSHASPVLAAASASGFRESGLQSLRCLEGEGTGPSPIVAVRSAGLQFESVIGYCDDEDESSVGEPVIRSLVTEEYLAMLIAMSDERFKVNSERRERFRATLLEAWKGKGKSRSEDWEDPVARRERKRAEGLARKKLLESQRMQDSGAEGEVESAGQGQDI
jgi:tRNA wybutosine-synthesizing protein 3